MIETLLTLAGLIAAALVLAAALAGMFLVLRKRL